MINDDALILVCCLQESMNSKNEINLLWTPFCRGHCILLELVLVFLEICMDSLLDFFILCPLTAVTFLPTEMYFVQYKYREWIMLADFIKLLPQVKPNFLTVCPVESGLMFAPWAANLEKFLKEWEHFIESSPLLRGCYCTTYNLKWTLTLEWIIKILIFANKMSVPMT